MAWVRLALFHFDLFAWFYSILLCFISFHGAASDTVFFALRRFVSPLLAGCQQPARLAYSLLFFKTEDVLLNCKTEKALSFFQIFTLPLK